MSEVDRDRVIGITGTKGKSTTTALTAFFLTAIGEKAYALGNIGLPPYDPSIDVSEGWLILEISSFQARDLESAPSIVALTSLASDHLDWHGTLENYQRDKLSITRLLPAPIVFFSSSIESSKFDESATVIEPDTSGLTEALGLLGQHNHSNVALALSVVSRATGMTVEDITARVKAVSTSFTPLPGRLTEVAREERAGCLTRYIDDGLATAALPTIAALSVFPEGDLVLIAGGFDRGINYQPLVASIIARPARTVVVTMGEAGSRIGALVHAANADVQLMHANDLRSAVELARNSINKGGVVLFSPAAPSFDHFKNWSERSAAFTQYVAELNQ
jgi:UDP-N-acetylmuramoylalanine--D-glutamate ligase